MPSATPPPRYRMAILASYANAALFVGVDPYEILRAARIDPRLLAHPERGLPADEQWVPAASVVQVLEQTAERSGRDDFAILLAECQSLVTIGPVDLLIEHERSVREIINATMEFRPLVSDALSISIEERGETAVIAFDFEPASPQLASMVIAHAREILVGAVEGTWRPLSVHFRRATPAGDETYRQFFRCPIVFGDSFDGFACDAADIDRISPSARPNMASYARSLLYLTPEMNLGPSFAERVKSTINLLLRHGTPELDRVAATLGTSRRTLQRLLAHEGHSFDKILNAVRRNVSTRNLAQSDRPISDVAYDSGFSSVSAFSRWFRNEFGLAPSAWRRARRRQVHNTISS